MLWMSSGFGAGGETSRRHRQLATLGFFIHGCWAGRKSSILWRLPGLVFGLRGSFLVQLALLLELGPFPGLPGPAVGPKGPKIGLKPGAGFII